MYLGSWLIVQNWKSSCSLVWFLNGLTTAKFTAFEVFWIKATFNPTFKTLNFSMVINLDVCLKMCNGRLFNASSFGQFCIIVPKHVCFFSSHVFVEQNLSVCAKEFKWNAVVWPRCLFCSFSLKRRWAVYRTSLVCLSFVFVKLRETSHHLSLSLYLDHFSLFWI